MEYASEGISLFLIDLLGDLNSKIEIAKQNKKYINESIIWKILYSCLRAL